MKVYKFGGASIKDANGVRNVAEIIKKCNGDLVVVVSAIGKMTNAFENLLESYYKKGNWTPLYNEIIAFHKKLIQELFTTEDALQLDGFYTFEKELLQALLKSPSLNFDFDYDRIVSYGELFSTSIITAFLQKTGCNALWTDCREYIRTSADYREAKIDWELSSELINKTINFSKTNVYVAQGFIGATANNQTTTLGREGSDFSAAVIAFLLNGTSVTIWKDVPGVLNADPRWYENAKLISEMSYSEAIELSFYGAQVIHPKTLKPLENKKIPLYVRSFIEQQQQGTTIGYSKEKLKMPILIKKTEQILITIAPLDFSFALEDNLKEVFKIFAMFRVKVNQMQISALNFSVCASYDARKFEKLLKELLKRYRVTYNLDLELLTIRHYNIEVINEIINGYSVLMEQRNRDTAWFVRKKG